MSFFLNDFSDKRLFYFTIMNNNYDKVGIAVENGYCAVIFTGGHTKEIGKD